MILGIIKARRMTYPLLKKSFFLKYTVFLNSYGCRGIAAAALHGKFGSGMLEVVDDDRDIGRKMNSRNI